jgi:hypothetical protein
MKIAEMLQEKIYNARVSCEDKWLVWNDGLWIIYQRKMYEKKTKLIFETNSEDLAVARLLED